MSTNEEKRGLFLRSVYSPVGDSAFASWTQHYWRAADTYATPPQQRGPPRWSRLALLFVEDLALHDSLQMQLSAS
jgi:hypothetical protein